MRTFGVEEELLLVDEHTGAPRAVAPQALAAAAGDDEPGRGHGEAAPEVAAEIHQEMLETQTRPLTSTGDLLADIVAGRERADQLVRPLGVRAAALAMSPLPVQPHPTEKERYGEMMRRYGATAHKTLVCGCHVHVGIASREEGVAVLDRIRTWLPVILALSANSPFADGADTGYASFRFLTWHQWQSAGPTEVFGSVEEYDRFERVLVDTGVILDYGMVYLDARLSHKQPTVEVRIADVCLDARDAVVLAAIIRALVDTAAEEWHVGVQPSDLPSAALRLAGWQAALTGTQGRLPHPQHGAGASIADALDALLAHIGAALEANGDLELVRDGLERIVAAGGGAGRQRAAFAVRGSLEDVVSAAVDATHELSRSGDDLSVL
ncbi:glutamate--cysteine ligase [Leifsonia sp. NPDC102414]|uniref:glutamate--cysteine ligase n=1 Tax=Leifsonia sp. NPDC102414 TaxID=3364124 RepID=UPI003819BC37